MEYKHVCKILSTHGLKGEVKVYLDTTELETRFKKNATLYIEDNGNYIEVKVKKFRYQEGNVGYLTLLNYEDINLIEPYLKRDIYGERLEFQDKIYLSDLIGYKVVNSEGEILGTIRDSYFIGSNAYIDVDSKLVPFIKNIYFSSVDEENKTVFLLDIGEELVKNA